MQKHEKLLLFLEMQGVDITTFLQIKKNELALLGYIDVFRTFNYQELLDKKSRLDTINPCLFTLYKTDEVSTDIKDFTLPYYQDQSILTLKDILENKKYLSFQKDEIIFRGIEIFSNEYKDFLGHFLKNNEEVLTYFSKSLVRNNKLYITTLKKYFTYQTVLIPFMLLFDYFYLRYNNAYGFYTFYYNFLFIFLILFVFVKGMVIRYIKNDYTQKNKISLYDFKQKKLDIMGSHDGNIEELERNISLYGDKNYELSYHPFVETNAKLKAIQEYMNKQIIDYYTLNFDKVLSWINYLNIFFWVSLGILFILTLFV